ncbi:hypothetical protein KXW65_001798 [Aspergillus fumigatus]|nr:hypothetical protein KXW65_001798 [Aspergillus fumigatus]KAH2488867.1 hypothetical protein KXV28_006926 [Aspergillus fumigatus]KAH2531042.1 hypothetical protein KXW12_004950 [Aspergillus fumigatus]KAH2789333.1 hypothetical protein KXW38_003499 [Aspergillus fumigatus]KAH2818081.1 hypothetical protein KXW07_006860 [Aspergillus fumigatus]
MAIPTPSIDEIKSSIDATLANLQSSLRELNREIWSNPETAYQEHKAHETICAFLEAQGCTVTRHAYGLDTSFEATCGSGGPLINFNAEYDALPGIGHACGHNLITTSSVAAFLALSALLKKYGIPGRAQLLGTPAEENGGGKRKLIEKGAYNGVDISLMAHAGPKKLFPGVDSDGIAGVLMNARKEIHCEFTGKSAHAGGNPWDGINALDALVSAYNNVSVLRQQMQPDERVHVAFTETPTVANVIPERTKAFWQVRRNVSYLVPTLHAMFAVADQEGLFLHHSSFATAAGTDTAHEEAVIVGKSLAMIGWDMLTDEGLFQTAKKQWEMAIVE